MMLREIESWAVGEREEREIEKREGETEMERERERMWVKERERERERGSDLEWEKKILPYRFLYKFNVNSTIYFSIIEFL